MKSTVRAAILVFAVWASLCALAWHICRRYGAGLSPADRMTAVCCLVLLGVGLGVGAWMVRQPRVCRCGHGEPPHRTNAFGCQAWSCSCVEFEPRKWWRK